MRYLVLIVSLLFAVAANADDLQRMQDRIDSLEKDLNMMQQEVYKGGSSSSKKSGGSKDGAKNDVRLNELEETMRRLNGKLEENENSINRLSEKLDKVLSDVDYRVNAMEAKAKEAKAAAPAPTPENNEAAGVEPVSEAAPAPAKPVEKAEAAAKAEPEKKDAVSDPLDHQGQYDKAFDFLRKSEYDKAEKAFKQFITANKGSDLVSNAYYWLGETYYVRENYDQSAINFLKGYQTDAKGNKAADNLLKLAMSLDKLKKKKEACTTLDKLLKEFPKVDAATKDKVTKEKASLKCS